MNKRFKKVLGYACLVIIIFISIAIGFHICRIITDRDTENILNKIIKEKQDECEKICIYYEKVDNIEFTHYDVLYPNVCICGVENNDSYPYDGKYSLFWLDEPD